MGLINKHQIIFIVGPTAVGKTAVGILLAQELGGEIISCDSMQVYRGMRIASNKPSEEELNSVPHHILDVVPLTQHFDVVQFEQLARKHINDILNRGKAPIVVGGTGMYMKVLIDGIFDSDHVPEAIRQKVLQQIKEKGREAAHQQLALVDPVAAKKIHWNDERRLVRALEIFYATGRPISELQQQASGLADEHDVAIFGLTMDRKALYDRIDQRVEEMFEKGLVDEIRSVSHVVLSKTASAIIGVKEVKKFLAGEISFQEAKDEMKKNTRHLAKRQLTWFRAEQRIQWMDLSGIDHAQATVKIISLLKEGL